MHIGYASTFQTQFYDRGVVGRGLNSYFVGGPHVSTQRWTYTVPSNKKAFVNVARVSSLRSVAAAPVSTTGSEIDVTNLDASSAQLALVRTLDNAIGAGGSQIASGIAPMVAGESITAVDVDNGTGGTVEFIQSAWVSEFSAG